MNLQEDSAAIDYYRKIITPDDVLVIKDLVKKIPRAKATARQYLQRHCQTPEELEEFFKENSHHFYVENRRVTLFSEELEKSGDDAEAYFKEVLEKNYKEPVHFMTLKKRHLGAAPDAVSTFITRFYPSKEFRHFLRSRPDVFVLGKDHKVFLVDVASVEYFKKRLKVFGREKLRFLDFRGHVGHAPPYVQEYIHRNYFGDDFQIFLRNHPEVFRLSKEGYVSLVSLQ